MNLSEVIYTLIRHIKLWSNVVMIVEWCSLTSSMLDQPCPGCLIHFCHLSIFFSVFTLIFTLPSCDRPWHTQVNNFLCPSLVFLLLYHFFYLFILSLQCCLACFALLFHPISSFRSFSQNPYCLFYNLSILLLLSLVHICLLAYVPWWFFWSIHTWASGTL